MNFKEYLKESFIDKIMKVVDPNTKKSFKHLKGIVDGVNKKVNGKIVDDSGIATWDDGDVSNMLSNREVRLSITNIKNQDVFEQMYDPKVTVSKIMFDISPKYWEGKTSTIGMSIHFSDGMTDGGSIIKDVNSVIQVFKDMS